MKAEEIANNLVKWCNNGEEARCYKELYSPNIISIEARQENPVSKGMDEVMKKGQWWHDTFEVHTWKTSEPIVADNWFSVRHDIDTTHKPSGKRQKMSEIGVYQVNDGKIVKEQFFYDTE